MQRRESVCDKKRGFMAEVSSPFGGTHARILLGCLVLGLFGLWLGLLFGPTFSQIQGGFDALGDATRAVIVGQELDVVSDVAVLVVARKSTSPVDRPAAGEAQARQMSPA
jgi:hypothetical protein